MNFFSFLKKRKQKAVKSEPMNFFDFTVHEYQFIGRFYPQYKHYYLHRDPKTRRVSLELNYQWADHFEDVDKAWYLIEAYINQEIP
jgi:hypothetical protein